MLRTRVGYCGGTKKAPTYRDLGDHTETVQVEFDPKRIGYEKLLEVFWAAHDPFSKSWSTQYKSILFTHGKEQARIARASIAALEKKRGHKVLTEVRPASTFWIAEDYHQKYRLRASKKLLQTLFGLDAQDGAKVRDSTLAARVNGWLSGHGTKAEIEAEVKALSLDADARKAIQKALGERSPVLCR